MVPKAPLADTTLAFSPLTPSKLSKLDCLPRWRLLTEHQGIPDNNLKNLSMPLFLRKGVFKRENGPLRQSGKRPTEVRKCPMNANGQFSSTPLWWKTAPLKRPIERTMTICPSNIVRNWGNWGQTQMGSDGLNRTLARFSLVSSVGVRLVPLKTHDFQGSRPDNSRTLTGP